MKGKTLILIDGHALAFRQFFALERIGMKTSDKQPTWAVFGFFKAVFDLLKNPNIKPDCIAVAFDVGRKTFRVKEYDQYKANREAMPDTLQSQMKLIFEGLEAFNIPIYTKEGFEADDVIGTICDKATKLGHKTIILTGDQDSFQLVDKEGFVKVLVPSKGELIEYDWDKVYEKLGVYPNQVVDYKGLRGDTSDNIPGIRGIGEKTAQKLLKEYQTMDEIFANCDKISGAALKEKIVEGKEIATLSRYLATIVKNVDIDFDFEHTRVELPDITMVTEFLQRMQFYAYIRNIDNILGSFDKTKKVEIAPTLQKQEQGLVLNQCGGQLGLFAQEVKSTINKNSSDFETSAITTKAQLEELVENLNKQTLISVDTETTGISILDSDLVGISIGYNEGYQWTKSKPVFQDGFKTKTFYIPISHQIGEQLELQEVLDLLAPVFENEKIKKTMQNMKFDYNMLKSVNVITKGIVFDTMLASYINDSTRKHGLKLQSLENLNHIMQEIEQLIGKGKSQISMACVNIEDATNYACDDAYATLELSRFWQENLDSQELKLLYDVEVPTALCLADMEYVGVSVDEEYLKKLSEEFSLKISDLEKQIFELAGMEFNIASSRQVADVLFNKMEIKLKKKTKGKTSFSTNAAVLEELAQEHKICEYMLWHRKYSKLRSTYTDSLVPLIASDNRVHTSYNQTVTTTGRLSSSNPNLQNIPIRTTEGNKLRQAFVAANPENYILSADYSQIELRLLAHCSGDDRLVKAFCAGQDIHAITASKIFEVPLAGVTKEMRYKAKAVNFGIIYGQSRYGLSKSIGITPVAAEEFIQKYFQTYPKVRTYMNRIVKAAYKNGYVETIYGRKRYLRNELASPSMQIREFAERAAINQPLQGAAADLIKMAMVKLHSMLKENNLKSKIVMQVHDELILEVEKDELEQVKSVVTEAMTLGQPFVVPLEIDLSYAHSWKEGSD